MKFKKKIRFEDITFGIEGIDSVHGGDKFLQLNGVSVFSEAQSGCIIWINKNRNDASAIIQKTKASLIICGTENKALADFASTKKSIILAEDPKFVFIQIVNKFLKTKNNFIRDNVHISPDAQIGESVAIGHNTVIGSASIGDNVCIGANVVIRDGVSIGNNSIIHSNVTIGEPGFNYATDVEGEHYRFPHLGGVKICERCEIGAQSFVSAGGLSATTISSGTKIAQYVYIGANVVIGKNCQIRARVSIMGSVLVGDKVTLAPGVLVRDQLRIGIGAFVGQGSNVVSDIPDLETWYGNPAKVRTS